LVRAVKVLLAALRSTLTVLPPPRRRRYDFTPEKLSQPFGVRTVDHFRSSRHNLLAGLLALQSDFSTLATLFESWLFEKFLSPRIADLRVKSAIFLHEFRSLSEQSCAQQTGVGAGSGERDDT
jgi:hypothetical protein